MAIVAAGTECQPRFYRALLNVIPREISQEVMKPIDGPLFESRTEMEHWANGPHALGSDLNCPSHLPYKLLFIKWPFRNCDLENGTILPAPFEGSFIFRAESLRNYVSISVRLRDQATTCRDFCRRLSTTFSAVSSRTQQFQWKQKPKRKYDTHGKTATGQFLRTEETSPNR
jgi:hypothetical protein